MKKHGVKKHLEESIKVMESNLSILQIDVEAMKHTVTLDNIGLYVQKQVEMFELEEKIKQAYKELYND